MAEGPLTTDTPSLHVYRGLDEQPSVSTRPESSVSSHTRSSALINTRFSVSISTQSPHQSFSDVTASDLSSKKQSSTASYKSATAEDISGPTQRLLDDDEILPALLPKDNYEKQSSPAKTVKFVNSVKPSDVPKKTFGSSLRNHLRLPMFMRKEERRQSASDQPIPLKEGLAKKPSKESSSGGSFQSQDSHPHKEMVALGTQKLSKASSSGGSFQSQDSHPHKEMVDIGGPSQSQDPHPHKELVVFRKPTLVNKAGSSRSQSQESELKEVLLPEKMEAETSFGGQVSTVAAASPEGQSVSLNPSGPSAPPNQTGAQPIPRRLITVERAVVVRLVGAVCFCALVMISFILWLTYPKWIGYASNIDSPHALRLHLNEIIETKLNTTGHSTANMTHICSNWTMNATDNTTTQPLYNMTNVDLIRCANVSSPFPANVTDTSNLLMNSTLDASEPTFGSN